MPWLSSTTQAVPVPRGEGYLGFTLPSTPGAVAWALRYNPATPIPDNLARIGFVVPSVLVDGEVLAGYSFSMASQPKNGDPFFQHFDYAYLENYPGLSARVSDFYVSFQPVPFIPPGNIQLLGLV